MQPTDPDTRAARRWWTPTVRVAVVLVLVVAAGAIWLWKTAGVDGADAENATLVATGRVVYDEYCAACHGANLEGQTDWRTRLPSGELPAPPHDQTGHTWHHGDRQLFLITKHGTAKHAPPGYVTTMEGFGEVLGDGGVWAVLAYIKSTWPENIRARQERRNAAGS